MMLETDLFLKTLERMENGINLVDAEVFYASAAISLKRIADALEKLVDFKHLERDGE